MCLVIQKKVNDIIIKCSKALIHNKKFNTYFTPFRMFKVPNTGILSCEDSDFGNRKSVGPGYIHAYIKEAKEGLYHHFDAYAINIKAYGTCDDLVCKFLYIPICDKTKNKRRIVNNLNKILLDPSWDKIRRIFPDHQYCFPYTDPIEWNEILKEMPIRGTYNKIKYNDPIILSNLLKSRKVIKILNTMPYTIFIEQFKKRYNKKWNTNT